MESAQGRGGGVQVSFFGFAFCQQHNLQKVKTVRQKDAGNAKNQVLFLSIEKRTLQDVLRWK